MVVEVRASEVKSHLVSVVKGESTRWIAYCTYISPVPQSDDGHSQTNPWVIFNDFTVRGITEDDALSFPAAWKVG